MGGAILVSHGGDLTSDAVAERVHAGALAALFRSRSCGQKGVIAVCFELFVGNHFVLLLPFPILMYHGGLEMARADDWTKGMRRSWQHCSDWGCGNSEFIFEGCERR